MSLSVTEIIRKKQAGGTHTEEELRFLVQGYTGGELKDYHLAAWLMAVFFKGMAFSEMQAWARLMWHSGVTFPRPERKGFWIDKHSTGGVGDKTSLILVPLVTCIAERLWGSGAVCLPMISGRGLDFSGGTLDKLDSVPGFSSQATLEKAMDLLERNGFFMLGQTADLAPADRLLYALRDVTATVECLPLIVSSILSKKLAENLDGLVFDVKFGSGAFMPDIDRASRLAHALTEVAAGENVRATSVLTPMEEPLGWKVGNQLEVEECADYLCGISRETGLHQVTVALALEMLVLASGGSIREADLQSEIAKELQSSRPYERFTKMFEHQGGDWAGFERRRKSLENRPRIPVTAPNAGYVGQLDARKIGQLVRALGGGRTSKESGIDPDVGVIVHKKRGDKVALGETVFDVVLSSESQRGRVGSLENILRVDSEPPVSLPWIQEVIRA